MIGVPELAERMESERALRREVLHRVLEHLHEPEVLRGIAERALQESKARQDAWWDEVQRCGYGPEAQRLRQCAEFFERLVKT